MEKCTDNLKDVIKKRNGSFQSYEILEILKQILDGYQFLYNNSILHRDLQPGNILINYNNEGRPIYKLTDFGVGKIQKKNDFDMTKTGTPVYAAPEMNVLNNDPNLIDEFKQIKHIDNVFSQIDVYSIGMTLYQLVFNDFPFQCTKKGITQFFINQKNEQFTIPQNKHENKVPLFIKIIEQTLQYNPNERIKFQELHSQVSRYFLNYKQRNTNFQQNLQIIPQQNLFIFREDNILTIKEYLNLTYEIRNEQMLQPEFYQVVQEVLYGKFNFAQLLKLRSFYQINSQQQYSEKTLNFMFSLYFPHEDAKNSNSEQKQQKLRQWLKNFKAIQQN